MEFSEQVGKRQGHKVLVRIAVDGDPSFTSNMKEHITNMSRTNTCAKFKAQ